MVSTKQKKEKEQKSNLRLLKKTYTVSALSPSKIKDKRVLVRIDANVPLKSGRVVDDTRLVASLPTIKELLKKGASKITLISHLGRPKGIDKSKSLKVVAKRLEKLLKRKVTFLPSHIYEEYEDLSTKERQSKIVLLENLRFDEREGRNSISFARELAKFGEIYVNDAFGTAHRKHTSNSAITKLLPSYTGLLMQKEIEQLGSVLFDSQKPFIVMVGFAKISDKIKILKTLLEKADKVLIGGAIAQTFFLSQKFEVGKSLVEEKQTKLANMLLSKYGHKMELPIDVVVANSLTAKTSKVVASVSIPKNLAAYDIGPKTTELFAKELSKAKNVFWNGPTGVFEVKPYNKSTNILAKQLAICKGNTIIGGGDTATAINKSGFADKMNHISTGGGASLTFLENPILPAFSAILKSHKK